MALAHQSIATINSPQFINLCPLDINPLMSSCEIKVFYLGANRNQSYISKQVATQMAKTLRGAPIVGYYKKDKQDYADHGQQLILDDEGIHFNCLTKPYGFVAPDAKVWFQDFQDQDEFGNSIVRTYLMTTGFLWTGQFQEAQQIFKDNGKPHSMELDDKTLKGHWANNIKEDMQFFIINDAIISKLCILGDDVEPCYEGSGITAPQVSKNFTLDSNFKNTLFKMMQQLTDALSGGKKIVENTKEEKLFSEQQDKEIQNAFSENKEEQKIISETSFEKKEEEKEKDTEQTDEESEDTSKDEKEEDKKEKDKYTLLEQEFNELKTKYTELEKNYKILEEFKLNVENQEKDRLINEFSMLSDEDKKDVIENKTKYTLEEIKSKLAVICFEKKVNFVKEEAVVEEQEKEEPVTTFTIESQHDFSTPEWVKAVKTTMNEI